MAAVPGGVSSFVGRADDLAVVALLVERERLVSVVGPGGSGKTRLTAEAVRAGSFAVHGFVELASVTSGDGLVAAVLAGCGIRDEPGLGPLERLRTGLESLAAVLVLDNCEQIRDQVAALVATLLHGCPKLTVLATSRVTLGLTGETVHPLTGLDEDSAAALFLDRARQVQPALPIGYAGTATAARICRLVDRLPLAIELAAAHARALALVDIETGMADRLRFLTTRDPNAMPQHRSLRASIGWSVTLVGDPARRALGALSVFEGRFTLDAALAVADPDGREAVETLVDHSLVQFDAVDGQYLLLDTIRDFAVHLDEAGTSQAHERLTGWVAELARGAEVGLGRAEAGALERVERDDAAVRSVLGHAARTGTGLELAAGIVVHLAFAWSLRGRCEQGRRWARSIGAALRSPPPALVWAQAFLTTYCGDFDTGYNLATEAAAQAAMADDLRTRARSLILIGMAQMFADPIGADPVLTEAAELAATAGDDWGHAEALQTLAYTHLFRTDFPAALRCVDAARPAVDRLVHEQLNAWDAGIRADIAARTGQLTDACTLGRTAMDIAVDIGEPVSANGGLLPLVRALCQRGRCEDAAQVLAEHQPFLDSHPGLGTAESLALAVAITATWTDPSTADPWIEQALARMVAAGMVAFAGEAAALLAVARLATDDPDGARAAADDALRWAEAIGNRETACAATVVRCAVGRRTGTDPSGEAYRALADAVESGLRSLATDALDLIAGLAVDAGRGTVAARLHAASQRLRDEQGAHISPLATLFRPDDERAVARALSAQELSTAQQEGGRLDLDKALAYARRARGRRDRPSIGWDSLTPTEHDVVVLAARGLSNQAIGSELLSSAGTVRTHLRSIFIKLGVSSRAQLAAEAARRGL